MTHTLNNSNNSYTDIFLLAAQHINTLNGLATHKELNEYRATAAHQCFYKDNKRMVVNPLKPTAIERAYVINKFLKLTSWSNGQDISLSSSSKVIGTESSFQ
jgi:hypothetical protein